jgi:integrase
MVLDAAPDTPQRPALRRFVEWAAAEGLRPEAVTDEHLRRFLEWRAATTHDLFLTPMASAARRLRNAMVASTPGFPGQRLVARGRDARRTLIAVSELPPVLQRELAAFAERLAAPVNPWEGKALASATVTLYVDNLRRALTLLAGRPQGLSDVVSVADLATPKILRETLEADWLAAGRRWREGTPQVSAAIIAYATRVLGFGDEQLRPLRELARRVKPENRGKLSPSVRRRLGAFDDDAVRGALFRVGAALRAEGERLRRDGSVIRGAERFRAGEAIDLLLRGCLRRRTLVEINVAKHLVRGPGGRIQAVHLDGDTTKNRVEVRVALPPDLARALDRYLSVHRAELPGAESGWLFASPRPGEHLGADGWGRSLARLVERHVGAEFTPHMARHIAASMLFAADAEAGRAVQHVLGHADPRTSRKYGVLVNRGAQRQFGELVDAAVARRHRRHDRSAR